jgi:hypothetical protein
MFYIDVKEYCEGSLLRASSLLIIDNSTEEISYGAGDVGLELNLGYPNKNLHITYLYDTSVLRFKYGGCVWSQDGE